MTCKPVSANPTAALPQGDGAPGATVGTASRSALLRAPRWRRALYALAVGGSATVAATAAGLVVTRWTGWVALAAIAIGMAVGRAVRWSSAGQGGRWYQLLAAALTYASIAACYFPGILGQFAPSGSESSAIPVAAGLAAVWPLLHVPANFAGLLGGLMIAVAIYEAWAINRGTVRPEAGSATAPGRALL